MFFTVSGGPFGLEGLVGSVSGRAIEHAGVPAQDIDATWLGNLNGGFVPDNFCSSFVLDADPALRWKPATRVENACASGSAAKIGRASCRERV